MVSRSWTATFELYELLTTPTLFFAGTNSKNNSTSLALRSLVTLLTPVMLPPGRSRLATNPAPAAGANNIPVTAPREPAPEATPAPPRQTTLTLQLSSESWVEVYDSRGERLYYDVASAGSVQSIEGRPPLRVVLGNAAAVAVQVNGQAREIPAGAVDGDGADFVISRSGNLRVP